MASKITVPYNVAIWGDSISQYGDKRDGWVTLLREMYQGKAMFFNLGISGLNSEQFLNMVRSPEFDALMPKVVSHIIIELGANDAGYGIEINNHQGVEIGCYRQNLLQLVQEAKKYTSKITIIVPTPLAQFVGRSPEQTDKYAQVAREVATELRLHCLDLRTKTQQNDISKLFCDGIHMSPVGNQFIFELVAGEIGEMPFWRDHWSVWKVK